MNVGGKTNEAAIAAVSEGIDGFYDSTLVFDVKGKHVEIPFRDLGITYNKEATIGVLTEVNKPDSLLQKAVDLPGSFFQKRVILPHYLVDFSVMNANLKQKFSSFEKQPVDATIISSGDGQVQEDQDGQLVNYGLLLDQLGQQVENLETKPIQVTFSTTKPNITAQALQKASGKYKKLVNSKIVFNYGYDNWNLGGVELIGMLGFEIPGRESGYVTRVNLNAPITILSLSTAEDPEKSVNITISDSKINNFLGDIAQQVDRPTVNATLKFENGKVTEFQPAVDGQKLDLEAIRNAVLNKVSVENLSNDQIISLKLPVTVTTAAVANEQINNLGIRELVGRGVSYFAGSIPNRMFNVELGSSRINGTLVGPGENFSFNKSVGEVNGATGYKQAYVISAGKTVLDDGGGICQVSTTVFRAALDAGLPIVSRTGHAYRVGYYEQHGFGPGLDATVWAPSVDFVFKNDTPHHILVQTVFDPNQAKLEVDLYGTRDGRRAEISTPVVSNETAPPPEKREDDPTLPKGTVKQVDFSAWGASTYFTRKVYRGDTLISNDVFNTNYRPWQAVFLVGTGG
jgi:vancomycin resistance protein YoaR